MKTITSVTPIKVSLVSPKTLGLSTALIVDGCLVVYDEIEVSDTTADRQEYVTSFISLILPDKNEWAKVVENLLSIANSSFLWITLAYEKIKGW